MSKNNSESPIIVWLDCTACDKGSEITRELLKATIGNLTVFNDKDECKRFFGRNMHKHRLALSVSGQLGKEFVPTIHEMSSILSIYVYCGNTDLHKQWSNQYTKIRTVIRTLDDLVSEILSDNQIN